MSLHTGQSTPPAHHAASERAAAKNGALSDRPAFIEKVSGAGRTWQTHLSGLQADGSALLWAQQLSWHACAGIHSLQIPLKLLCLNICCLSAHLSHSMHGLEKLLQVQHNSSCFSGTADKSRWQSSVSRHLELLHSVIARELAHMMNEIELSHHPTCLAEDASRTKGWRQENVRSGLSDWASRTSLSASSTAS